jgi:N-methylhydantoinase B
MPVDISEIGGEEERLVGKGPNVGLSEGDVSEYWWGGCSGYGDPLKRDPERVADDIRKGKVTKNVAETVYGVILDEEDNVRPDRTEAQRDELREARLENARKTTELIPKEVN